jgi:hypothetical protein
MVSKECPVTCRMQLAYISTNRYPAQYMADETCVWNIEGSYGQYVELNILSLDIISDKDCMTSYIELFDIDLNGWEVLIGRFCTQNKPYRIISSRWQKMRIEFRSGSQSIYGSGFFAIYTLLNVSQNYPYANHDSKFFPVIDATNIHVV